MKKIVYANKDIKIEGEYFTMTIKKGIIYKVERVGSKVIQLMGDDNSVIFTTPSSFDKLVEKGELE